MVCAPTRPRTKWNVSRRQTAGQLAGTRSCGGCSATPIGASSSGISPSSAPLARTTRLPEDELVSGGITRAFYPHGLGHSLGLQCHDVGCALRPPRGDNPFLRNTSDIAPRQVFTIEPGLYFIEALLAPLRHSPDIAWKLGDALSPFGGIRIEDH